MPACEICGKQFERQFGGGNLTEGGTAFRCPECAAKGIEGVSQREGSQLAAAQFAYELKQIAPAQPVVTWFLIAACGAVFALEIAKGAGFETMPVDLAIRLGANYGPQTLGGEWWRLLTSMFLHFGFLHILFNMVCLWSLGSLAERLMGRYAFIVLYFATGLFGSLASVAVHPQLVSAGASGAVFGVAGGLVSYLWMQKAPLDYSRVRKQLKSLGIFLGINLIYSLQGGVDMMAHIGGLVSGFAIAAALPRFLEFPAAQTIPSPIREVGSKNKRITEVGIVCAILILAGAIGIRRLQGDSTVVNSALQQIDAGKSAEVIPTLEQIVKRQPNMALAHFALGAAYLRTGRPADAARELRVADELDPGNATTQHQLGIAFLGQNDYKNAIIELRKSLKTDPENPPAHLGLAMALLGQDQNQEAAEEARTALKSMSDNSAGHAVLGQSEIGLGQTDDGIHELEIAVKLDPTNADFRTTLVNAYLATGKFDKANALKSQTGK